jgi:hypothetical protein
LSEESPSETLLSSREAMARAIATPTVVAIATPTMKDADTFSGLGAVTKMIADMICGPAIIVMARGKISRFMGSSQSTAAISRGLLLHISATTGYIQLSLLGCRRPV